MLRLLAILAACAATLTGAQGLFETDPEKIIEGWHREKLEEVRSGDAHERAAAARWLGGRNDAATIEALTRALADPESKVREEAAGSLWKAGKSAEPARAALTDLLEDPDPDVIAQAAGALQVLGMAEAELADARKRALGSPGVSPHSRYLLARNLVGFEDPLLLLPDLLGYLERSATGRATTARTRVEAAQRSLTRLVDRTRDPRLVGPLREAARTLRGGNAFVLVLSGKIQPRPADHLESTLAFLEARDAALRRAAMELLRDTNDEAAAARWAPRVARLLRDADEEVRWNAAWTLETAGPVAASQAEALAAALADPAPSVRRRSAQALGSFVAPGRAITAAERQRVAATAHPALQALAARDADGDVRKVAAAALQQMEQGQATLATAAVTPTPHESRGLATLRARHIAFEPDMFQRALYEGDVEAVRAFLDAGMSAKAPFPGTGTPLWVMLFDPRSCDPSQRPTRAETKAVMQLLLERGADPNIADAQGNVPLMAAATRGCDREVMRMLLRAGAKVDARNTAGLTPFEFGLVFAHDGLEELLAAGYRLPPEKVKIYRQAYADRPAAQVMIRKASGRK